MNFPDRYARNQIITDKMQAELRNKTVAVIGLGGLGGFVAEELVRFGVGHILGFDFDRFSETNLNRQLFCTERTLDRLKTEAAAERLKEVNSDILFKGFSKLLARGEMTDAIRGCDAVMDCLDTAADRLALEEMCEELSIPLIHGSIGGWIGQVCTVFPGDRLLRNIYSGFDEADNPWGNAVFTAGLVASLQVSEAVKVLTGEGTPIRNRVLFIDLASNEFEFLDFSETELMS